MIPRLWLAIRALPALVAAIAVVTLVAGCAAAPPVPPPARCAALIADVDRRVVAAGVPDGGPRRIAGHPYARVNRWLLAVIPDAEGDAFTAWAERARALDRTARRLELRNLGVLPAEGDRVQGCAEVMLAQSLATPSGRAALATAASVPDDYVMAARVAGLYPITSLGLLAGVARLRQSIEADFGGPLDSLPVRGRLVRFSPRGSAPAGHDDALLPVDPLGLPSPGATRLDGLFARHAPVFEVDVVQPDDRIATLELDAVGEPLADPSRPTVYRRISYTRVHGRMRLQLEYWAWFAARPRSGPLDILGGRLDGVIWRVTLDERGAALAYDSIHPCGCYHMVFPTGRLLRRPPPPRFEEPLLVPQDAPQGPGAMVIRVAWRSHYIQRIYRDAARDGVIYRLQPYDGLRSLPLPEGGHRSLFRPDGLVPASVRPERWLLWMSGVASPGAMRQGGRHAIAFVGRRHFDDADLLARFFTVRRP